MSCPDCGSTNVDHQAPGPGEGGLFRLRCRECGYELSGIADPGGPGAGSGPGAPPVDRGNREQAAGRTPRNEGPVAGRCSVCGKPGRLQNLPGGVPVSGVFCDEHVPEHTLKPLSCLLALVAFGLAVLVAWLVYRVVGALAGELSGGGIRPQP